MGTHHSLFFELTSWISLSAKCNTSFLPMGVLELLYSDQQNQCIPFANCSKKWYVSTLCLLCKSFHPCKRSQTAVIIIIIIMLQQQQLHGQTTHSFVLSAQLPTKSLHCRQNWEGGQVILSVLEIFLASMITQWMLLVNAFCHATHSFTS